MKQIRIASHYTTKFGELWGTSLEDLLIESVTGVVKNFKQEISLGENTINAVFVANMASGMFNNQMHLNAYVSQLLAHFPPTTRVESACASGSLAVITAIQALNSGRYKTVLVVGAEKMTDVSSGETTKILAGASDFKSEYGSTFPALYSLLANAHMRDHKTTREHLSSVSVKNHRHAVDNARAQFRREFTLDQVSNSTMVSDPLRLLDCSPVSDGASTVILTTIDSKKLEKKAKIFGIGHAQDSLALKDRKSLTQLQATIDAAKQAYAEAGVVADDIQMAEVHDCFTIAEILAIEDLGFFEKGFGGHSTIQNKTTHGGKLVINPSGGLKACGHPVGATGVKQIAFLAEQIERQNAKTVLAHNVGGSGATAIVTILGV